MKYRLLHFGTCRCQHPHKLDLNFARDHSAPLPGIVTKEDWLIDAEKRMCADHCILCYCWTTVLHNAMISGGLSALSKEGHNEFAKTLTLHYAEFSLGSVLFARPPFLLLLFVYLCINFGLKSALPPSGAYSYNLRADSHGARLSDTLAAWKHSLCGSSRWSQHGPAWLIGIVNDLGPCAGFAPCRCCSPRSPLVPLRQAHAENHQQHRAQLLSAILASDTHLRGRQSTSCRGPSRYRLPRRCQGCVPTPPPTTSTAPSIPAKKVSRSKRRPVLLENLRRQGLWAPHIVLLRLHLVNRHLRSSFLPVLREF